MTFISTPRVVRREDRLVKPSRAKHSAMCTAWTPPMTEVLEFAARQLQSSASGNDGNMNI